MPRSAVLGLFRPLPFFGSLSACVFLGSIAQAQVSDPTRVLTRANLAAPAVGQSVVDPTFGVTIRRLTDRGQTGGLATAEYPQLQAINADETLVLLSTDADYRVMDLATLQITHLGIDLSMPRWHPVEANVIIGQNFRSGANMRFQRLELRAGGTWDVVEVANISQLGYSDLELGSWEDASDDGRYVGIIGELTGQGVSASILDLTTGTFRLTISVGGVDWVAASPSGDYFAVQYATRGLGAREGLVIYDADTGAELGHVTDHHEHGDLAVDENGNDAFGTLAWTDFCANGEAPCFSVGALPNGATTQRHLRIMPEVGNYTSCRNHRRGGFCVTSDDYGMAGTRAFGGEIWLTRFADGGVLRLVHHRTSACAYYNLVRPVLSPSGRYLLFTSDWARANCNDQADLYVIDLEPYLDAFLDVPPPPVDGGVPDSGPPPPADAGFDDSGAAVDSGVITPPPADSGVVTPPADASVAPDASASGPIERESTHGGCGCSAAHEARGSLGFAILLGAWAVRRRRAR